MTVSLTQCLSKDPVIIGGCGRSGTSLLLSILSAHPNIVGIPEETAIFSQERRYSYHIINNLRNYIRLMSHIRSFPLKKTAHRWCEKTPRNVRFFHTINKEFRSKVKLIHIIRDGRDVITSSHPQFGDYYVSVHRWVHDVRSGLDARCLPNVYEVKYEDMVMNYKETIKGVLDFIGESFVSTMIDFHKYTNVKGHLAFKGHFVREVTSNSVNKWKNPVHKKVIDDFYKNKEAVTLLKELGYTV